MEADVKSFLTVCAVLLLMTSWSAREQGAGGIEPILRLEKPRYIAGEAIRFWLGVKPKNTPTIPEELRKPCSLGVTKPDGTRRVQSVGWPLDGMVEQGWSGGWGIGDEMVEPGVYVLVLESVLARKRHHYN
jgi:hypothetical protein